MKPKTLLLLGCALAVPALAFAAASTNAMFTKMDANHDGRISADEHAAGAPRCSKRWMPTTTAR